MAEASSLVSTNIDIFNKKLNNAGNDDEKEIINKTTFKEKLKSYIKHPSSFIMLMLVLIAAFITVAVLGFLVIYILVKGIPNLSLELFSLTYTSDNVSMLPSIINTLITTVAALLISVPLGIGAAIYLVEYAKTGNKLVYLIRIMTETLSGIPSIVYGLFGMLFFVTALGWRYCIAAGAVTLSIMVLPLIIRTTEEALIAVPMSYREGSFGLGAGKLRTILCVVLPSAVPGILSGVILAIGRMVGETAALMYTSGTVADIGKGRTLSLHMYCLSREGLHTGEAYATAVVLLVVVMLINWVSGFAAKRVGSQTK